MKHKNNLLKIFSFFLLFLLIFSIFNLINTDIIQASSYVSSTGFEQSEGSVLGDPFANSWLSTYKVTGTHFYITNIYHHKSSRSFLADASAIPIRGFFNFSYPSDSYITSFSFWAYSSSETLDIKFKDSVNTTMIEFYIGSGFYPRYVDWLGSYTTLDTRIFTGGMNYLSFSFIDNQTVAYTYANATSNDKNYVYKTVTGTPRNIKSNPRITRMYVTLTNPVVSAFDDFNMTVSGEFNGGGSPIEAHETYCEGSPVGTFLEGGKNIELKVNQYFTGEIVNFKVLFDKNMLSTGYSDLSTWWLFINGQNLSSPKSWTIDGDFAWLEWNSFFVSAVNTPLVIEFKSTYIYPDGDIPPTTWYYFADGGDNSDSWYYGHTTPSKFGDGVYFGHNYTAYHSLIFCLDYINTYEPSIDYVINCDYNLTNAIKLNKYLNIQVICIPASKSVMRLENATGYVVQENIFSALSVFNFNVLLGQEYGIGIYNFYVIDYETYRNNYPPFSKTLATNYKILVDWGMNRTYDVRVYPNPVSLGNPVSISYLLPVGQQSYILITDTENYPFSSSAVTYWNSTILYGTGQWKTLENCYYPLVAPKVYYLHMFNSSGHVSGIFSSFYCVLYSGQFHIYISENYISLGDSIEVYGTQYLESIAGGHVINLVFKLTGGNPTYDTITIGARNNEFSFDYQPKISGVYEVYISIDDYYSVYANYKLYLTVNDVPLINPDDNSIMNLLSSIPAEAKVFLALIIIVVLALLPMLFAVMLAHGTQIESIEIPALLSVAFFCLGVVISVMLQLIEIWALFFILFALIITFAILWVQRQIAG